jgi:hypothetical protein
MKHRIVMTNGAIVTRAVLSVAASLALWGSSPAARAGQGNAGNPGILPPQSHAFGRSYAEWAAAWWHWSLELPLEGHPFYGCPGSCDAGQSGPVWFLAGGPTDCACQVPTGKALFFPIVNAEASSLEDPPFHGDTAAEQRDVAKWWADHIVVASLACEIDGVPVKSLETYRFVSPQITFTAPTPWAFGAVGGPGTSVGDGYYLLLRPLSRGSHTIHFSGTSHFSEAEGDPFTADFGIDTTYQLTVSD